MKWWPIVAVGLGLLALTPEASAQERRADEGMSIDQAVSIALQRNRDVLATRLDIEAARIDEIAAKLYWNPILNYQVGNIVLGRGNPQGANVDPGPFSQLIQTVSVSEVIDVWSKRAARMKAAAQGLEQRHLVVEDALREIIYAVKTAFADVTREQLEDELAHNMKSRYDETIRVSRSRFLAGEISEAEFRKIELEGMRYQNAVVDADSELDLSRQALAGLCGLSSATQLPGPAVMATDTTRTPPSLPNLTAAALRDRPDLRAANHGKELSEAQLEQAKREAYPDISLGVGYTHSGFTVSGDNANSAALMLSLPLPVFDRNQAMIARSHLDSRRFDNDAQRLVIQIQQEVAQAVRKLKRADSLLDMYESGGMLERSDRALKVAESMYKAGAVSLIDLLEAQRTYIDNRAQYLRAQHDYRQSLIDVTHVTGKK